jgi:hypothetical protein
LIPQTQLLQSSLRASIAEAAGSLSHPEVKMTRPEDALRGPRELLDDYWDGRFNPIDSLTLLHGIERYRQIVRTGLLRRGSG